MIPESYTIDATGTVIQPCPQASGTPLGTVCTQAVWGQNVDIWVTNNMPNGAMGFVNVLMDWDRNGWWGGASGCPTAAAPEWVLQNFPVPNGYSGPLSWLIPPAFLIGPQAGYVWTRFTISEQALTVADWDGSGVFEDGESEDYLLRVDEVGPKPVVPNLKWSQPPIEIYPGSPRAPLYCGWDEPSLREFFQPGPYMPCWACPTQCHGDADCDGFVGPDDMIILQAAFDTKYGDPLYNDCADFSRDLAVNTIDLGILQAWFGLYPPGDCPDQSQQPGTQTWRMVADDFRCLGIPPVTSIHWWGSYVGWDINDPPQLRPISWRISFWTNVPAGPGATYSYPEKLIWQIDVPATRVTEEWVGRDQIPDQLPDTCFQYFVKLDPNEYFQENKFLSQTKDNTYWISIAAVYPVGVDVTNPWGWKTRPAHWMDDAVRFYLTVDPMPGMVLSPLQVTPIEYMGESYDAAFELDTDANFVKWHQPYDGIRNWPLYEDEPSMARTQIPGGPPVIQRLVADDWKCQGFTPVIAAAWWGSYIGYGYEACQFMTAQPRPQRPDYFLLNIWTDVAANDPCNPLGYSHPGTRLWEYRAYNYDQVMVGYDKKPHGDPNEPVFRYSVSLPQANWFKQKDVNGVYWFSVVAVYDLNEPNYAWGWTNHKHVYNDDAVAGVQTGLPPVWSWTELYDQASASEDMSFILFTKPGCFPSYDPNYNAWVALGEPNCWCYPRQCHGDADGKKQGNSVTGIYWVGENDLNIFSKGWKVYEPPKGPGLQGEPNICGDYARDQQGNTVTGIYRVGENDLNKFTAYWKKLEPPKGSGTPPDCGGTLVPP
jgi:hypothetical protein